MADQTSPDILADGIRKPIKARLSALASAAAAALVRRNVASNTISLASIVFAAIGALGFVLSRLEVPAWLACLLYLLAIIGIQGRLICNLLDGRVAVASGKKGIGREVFSDLPDRIADPILLVAAGYGVGLPIGAELGWIAGIGAVLTAYVRVLGQSIGAGTYFIGPMAKQHRMAVLTGACVLAGLVAWIDLPLRRYTILAALLLIVAGCAFTIARRLRLIFRDLHAKGGPL